MKPVAIFRHASHIGPGYFSEYLDAHGFPWTLIAIDEGLSVPSSVEAFSGLCFMGGPKSVNDDLPWIAEELVLIRQAVASNVPVIGHCLGGQLLAKALGGRVGRNPVKEIGWTRIFAEDNPEARRWLGETREFPAYEWHGETFELPEGAVRILANEACANQAFVLGPHLGMQCHPEVTEALVDNWNRIDWPREIRGLNKIPPSMMGPERQAALLDENLPRMRALLTDVLYGSWVRGLA